MKCPVCNTVGVNSSLNKCPNCNSDLEAFKYLGVLNRKEFFFRRIIIVLSVIVIILLAGFIIVTARTSKVDKPEPSLLNEKIEQQKEHIEKLEVDKEQLILSVIDLREQIKR